jgi:hypothetical protein
MYMKKLGVLVLMSTGIFLTAQAQIDSVAKKVGNTTAQTTVKGKSALVDEVYKDKMGPAGQSPIFIDHNSKYYYVDEKGKKVYVPKSSLKDKPKS